MGKPWVELEPDIGRLAVEAARARLAYAVETLRLTDEPRWQAWEAWQAAEDELTRAIDRAAARHAGRAR